MGDEYDDDLLEDLFVHLIDDRGHGLPTTEEELAELLAAPDFEKVLKELGLTPSEGGDAMTGADQGG